MKNYYRIELGAKSVYAAQCIAGNFIGVACGIEQDLSDFRIDTSHKLVQGMPQRLSYRLRAIRPALPTQLTLRSGTERQPNKSFRNRQPSAAIEIALQHSAWIPFSHKFGDGLEEA